jgi:hypothetical protein
MAGRILVVMFNNDVYYISPEDKAQLLNKYSQEYSDAFGFKDAYTGRQVVVNIRQVSSIVEEK